MSKTEKNKDGDSRKIKQIYLSEDGNEENRVVTKADEKEPSDRKKTDKHEENAHGKHAHEDHANHNAHHHEMSQGTKTIRIIAVAVAMLFSLALAMSVGVGLALWDSGRTIADLKTAMFAREVAAATPDTLDDEEAFTTDPDQDVSEPEPVIKEQSESESEPEDYGSTISSETEGLENVSKAGDGDEIIKSEENEAPAALADPMAGYPLSFTTVDESYFTDALFIGDSRLQGFGFWSGLPATYYCATGFQLYKFETANVVQTENGKVPIFQAMPYDAFTKIYIKVGLNELGFGTEENFENYYAQLIAKLREYEPRAIIYVHGILPVTAKKSETDKAHNNPNIRTRNAALEKFAISQKAYYLDAGPVVSDEEGNLRPEMTSDGIHLKPEHMKAWRDYLCEHAVVIE